MSIERKLETLEEKIGHANRKLEWLIAREEERDYRIDNPDHRTPSPLVLALREIAATIFEKLENVMTDTTAIEASVARANAGIESAIALLNTLSGQNRDQAAQIKSLADQLAAAIAAGDPAAQQAVTDKLNALAAGENVELDKLDAATAAIAQSTTTPPTP